MQELCSAVHNTRCKLRAKLHYTDTGYEHQLRTPPTNTTNGQKFVTSQHIDMSRCWALALRCGNFVVELL